MEANRLEMRDILARVMEDCYEEPNLYFQPPESMKISYPCIVYHLRTMTSNYANDAPYRQTIGYDVTYITRSPTSAVPAALVKEPYFAFDRYYTSNNLHHYAYTVTTTLKEVNDG